MRIGIGIDTGGTCTDAVAYNFENARVLASAKAETTRADLSLGILAAIDRLPEGLAHRAEWIALSTTLATNACVEDRGGRAKLVFFGGDARLIDEAGAQYGLPPAREMHIQESFTNFSGVTEREPDWDYFVSRLDALAAGADGIGIVEVNAPRGGAPAEKKAQALIRERFGPSMPAVCGHELFNALNVLQRASGTLLNARLFPVILEFLDAVKRALAARDITAELVIVRSDGSLMSESFARLRPVETLLCGPAASAAGGALLAAHAPDESRLDNTLPARPMKKRAALPGEPPSAGAGNCVIVDMGGTTTDISLVADGRPVTVTNGVSIGKWKTFVDGLYVKTVGLGGDSAVRYAGGELKLTEFRVVPLCAAASRFPEIVEGLRRLAAARTAHTHFLHEFLLPGKPLPMNAPQGEPYTEEERRLRTALEGRALSLTEAAAAAGRDIYSFKPDRLVREGVVQRAGLTPTDAMHLRGDFGAYDAEAARLAAECAGVNTGMDADRVAAAVYGAVERKLYAHIVRALLEQECPAYQKNGFGREAEDFIRLAYDAAEPRHKEPSDHNVDMEGARSFIAPRFATDFTLVGIGAPIGVFLRNVARRLNTRAVVPQHYQVANALGAVAGGVSATAEVWVKPVDTAEGVAGYTVHALDGAARYETYGEALAAARREAERQAQDEAAARGAKGAVTVTSDAVRQEARGKDAAVFLGAVARARAVGSIGWRGAL